MVNWSIDLVPLNDGVRYKGVFVAILLDEVRLILHSRYLVSVKTNFSWSLMSKHPHQQFHSQRGGIMPFNFLLFSEHGTVWNGVAQEIAEVNTLVFGSN